MANKKHSGFWQFRTARDVRTRDKFVLKVLVFSALLCVINLADWWFKYEHVGNIFLFILLSLAFWWVMLRLVIIWIGLLKMKKADPAPMPPKGMSVAIFTTSSPGEPPDMFEKTLAACAKINYPHTTYLLDDTQDPRFKAIAEKHGAVWLELVGFPGAKAGKINEAIKRTREDFILILDPDHIPFPEFLDQTLGYFQVEKVGFVQVCQAYYNQYRSFTAAGAAEQTYTFYGPSQMSLHGMGAAVAIGANCTFRRKALESIGGHGIGLAEDLVTSIRLHAAGWKSVYNPVIVSRGLVPEDLGSFCKQQLKWARGLFEVAFSEISKGWKGLHFWQKLSYLTISTYYFTGVTMLFFTLIPFLFFLTGILPAQMYFAEFLLVLIPVLLLDFIIYIYIQRWLCHPGVESGLHWRGMILKFACTPVFVRGFLLSLINAKIPYIPTAKKAATGSITPFIRPLIYHVILTILVITGVLWYRYTYLPPDELIYTAERIWGMIFFASIPFVLSICSFMAALEARNLKEEAPWDHVSDIKNLH